MGFFFKVKPFLYAFFLLLLLLGCRDSRGSHHAGRWQVSNSRALSPTNFRWIVIPFFFLWISLNFARFKLRKEWKICTITNFFFFTVMHYNLKIIFYLLQTEWPWLPMPWGMTKCNHYSVFWHFDFLSFFLFDRLEKNFLLYMNLSIHIYIFTKIYI